MNREWKSRVKLAMKTRGITQESLAEHLGKTQPWLSQKLRGVNRATYDDIILIAEGIEEDPAYILTGQKSLTELAKSTPAVPLISWESTLGWPGNRMDVEILDWVYPHQLDKISVDAFAVKQIGDSMLSQTGEVQIPNGAILIADPAIEPQHESFVMVSINERPSCKKLTTNGVIELFKSINPEYPPVTKGKNSRILAVVIESITVLTAN